MKLDENLAQRCIDLLHQANHDVTTVIGQGLCSTLDRDLIKVCQTENRCLVTLDLNFGNPLRFNPADYPGIAVLRLPPRPTPENLVEAVQTLHWWVRARRD